MQSKACLVTCNHLFPCQIISKFHDSTKKSDNTSTRKTEHFFGPFRSFKCNLKCYFFSIKSSQAVWHNFWKKPKNQTNPKLHYKLRIDYHYVPSMIPLFKLQSVVMVTIRCLNKCLQATISYLNWTWEKILHRCCKQCNLVYSS